MFLTKFQLNPTRREVLRLIASPQRLHAAVLSTFPPDTTAAAASRVLWRLDQPQRHELNLYLVSPARPSLEVLQSEFGWSQEPSGRVASYGPFLDRLDEGQAWRFRLTANPVRSVRTAHGQRGKVSPHLTVEQQREWLVTHAERHGFSVSDGDDGPAVDVTRRDRESFVKGAPDDKRRATISRAQFDGVLLVRDPEVLRSSLTHGIGRAKAYGCGLMTLAPVR